MINIDQLRQEFFHDCFATEADMIIEDAREGYARCSFQITQKHLNARGTVQGGAIFTLGDFAFAVAANCAQETAVSISASISYMKPPKGTQLIAQANLLSKGRTACFYQITITDNLQTPVATMTINGHILPPT